MKLFFKPQLFFYFILVLAVGAMSSCAQVMEQADSERQSNYKDLSTKMKGTHVFGRIDSSNVTQFKENNIEWIALVPWAFQADYQSAEVRSSRGDSLEIIKRNNRWINQINTSQNAGYKVFLKPHLWLGDDTTGMWRSDVFPTNDENWELWKSSYREFILSYAKIAEETEAELYCIGVEFSKLTEKYPAFWRSLIKDVRNIYSGKITYAANWYQEYEHISFWDQLDYIGIQAYFPLTKNDNPTTKEIAKGWEKHIARIESVQKKFKKPVLFTELGYKSTIDSAKEPWTWVDHTEENEMKVSNETQNNCYTAFFDTVWKAKWMAGLFIWQMRVDHNINQRKIDIDFTPQAKPAEKIIREAYGKQW